jgi:hypothetical protein
VNAGLIAEIAAGDVARNDVRALASDGDAGGASAT